MDRRYRNAFDQIHMSAACQARILAAASSASSQEEESAMKKPKNVLKTMLLAAALAGCLSAVAYASNNMLPEQLSRLSNVTLSTRSYDVKKATREKDGSITYILEKGDVKAEVSVNEPELKANNQKVSVEEFTAKDGEATLGVVVEDVADSKNPESEQKAADGQSKPEIIVENAADSENPEPELKSSSK